MKTGKKKLLIYALETLTILLLCFFPLCYRIDAPVIRQWDEARNAVNAVEMLQNQNYLVRYYEGAPEVWEVKPPLLIWLQVASLKIFGINELAIRFPIIIATFLTLIFLIWYFHKFYKKRYIGYIASLILVTSQGYIDRHIARTGDHDALLILFITVILLMFHRYIIIDRAKPLLIISISLIFVLSVLTKSIAALFVLPGLLIAVFIFRSAKKLFSDKWFYFAIVLFILLTGSYYVIREIIQPGYLEAVWHEELLPRYTNSESRFDYGTFWYYWNNLLSSRFTYWIYFLPAAIIILPFLAKGMLLKLHHYILIHSVAFFILISAGTKGLWYDSLLFPLFSIIIALGLYHVFHLIFRRVQMKKFVKYGIASLALALIFMFPYKSIIQKVSRTQEYPWDLELYSMGYLLRDQDTLKKMPDRFKIVFDGYNAHLRFYMEAINYATKRERVLMGNFSTVKPGEVVLISQKNMLDSIQKHYPHSVLFIREPVKLIKICK